MSTKNNTQRFAKIANRREHYGIRKLTVGVASVLLGTTLWLGKNADMVHADETDSGKDSSNQAESSDVTMPSVSENTQVRVEAPQAASNEDQSSVSGDAQSANTQNAPQSSENEQKVTVPATSEHAENQITVDSSDAKTQSIQTSASGVKTQENNSQAVASNNNENQSTNAVTANKVNDAGQNSENKSTDEPAKIDEKVSSIQDDLKQNKVETKDNGTQELKVSDSSSDLNNEELVANLTKGNQILVKQSKSVLNAASGKSIDPKSLTVSELDESNWPDEPDTPNPSNPSTPVTPDDPPSGPVSEPDPDDRTAMINYVDSDDNDNQIATSGLLSGKFGETINYSTANTISNLENQGYELVSNGFPSDATFEGDDDSTRFYIVTLKHGTRENEVTATATQTVHFVGAGDENPEDDVQSYDFTRTDTIDKVTGNTISTGDWNESSHTFDDVGAEVINGYHADQNVVDGETVTPDDLTKEITVTYTPNGKIIPVDPMGNPIPNAPQPQYRTDPGDPSGVVADESTPDIPGYTPNRPTITPTDPDKDTPVLYTRNSNPVIANGVVVYRDDTTGDILATDNLEGNVGDEITYTTADKIQNYENEGYRLVSNNFIDGRQTFAKDGNNFNVHFVHATAPINPENSYGRTDLTKTVKETVHYVDEATGKPLANDYTNVATFTGEGLVDKVTGKMLAIQNVDDKGITYDYDVNKEIDIDKAASSDFVWSASVTLPKAVSPTIPGYEVDASKTTPADLADNNDIKAIGNVGYDHANIEAAVYYKAMPQEVHKAELSIYANDKLADTASVDGAKDTSINFGAASDIVSDLISQGYKFDHAQDLTNNQKMNGSSYSELNFGNFSKENNSDQKFAIYLTKDVVPEKTQQNAQLTIRDVTLGHAQDLGNYTQPGLEGDAVSFGDAQQFVQSLLDKGYVWDGASYNGTNLDAKGYSEIKFGNYDSTDDKNGISQKWVINLVHGYTPVNPDHPDDKDGFTKEYLDRTITRTINYIDEQGNQMPNLSPVRQVAHFEGSGYLDNVTNKWVTVENGEITGVASGLTWRPDTNVNFDAIDAQMANGYHVISVSSSGASDYTIDPDGSIGAQTVNKDTPSSTVTIVYGSFIPVTPDTPDQSRVSITFNDVDANAAQDSDEVRNQLTTPIVLTGTNGSTIDLSQVTVPTNFLLSGDRPTDKKFGTDNAITLNVTHQRQDVSATDPNASTSVKRTITVTNPNDGDHDMSQTLTLHRSAVKDLVTNTVDYGQWNNGQFGEVVVPAVVGYTPSQTTIPAVQNVTADYVDPKIHVVYTADDSDESTQIISYVNDGKEVGQQVVKGKVGDTFHITPELPDGWEREKNTPVNITISPNGKGTTIVVPVDPLKITISPDQVTKYRSIWGTNDHDQQDADILPGTKGKYLKNDLNYGALHTLAQRSIFIISPDGKLSNDSNIQTVAFKRSAIVNAITGEVERYTDWTPEDGDGFDKMTIPVIDGYTASQSEVPELDNISADYQDPRILITYKGNPNQQVITYKDTNGNVVDKQTIDGNNGQVITINSTIPDGYKLADNSEDIPKKTELEPNNKEINVVVTPIVSTIDSSQVTPDKPIKTTDVLSGTQNKHLKSDLTYNDLHKDVTRTVTVKLPDGTTLPTVQTVHFIRSANINKATGDVTYTNWTPEGDASLAKIDIPAIDGYSPNETVINPIANVTDNYQDPKIEITYKPSDSSQTINFVDGNGNVVGTQKISGTTNEIKDLTIQTPDGWQTATGNLPKQVRIHSSDTPISIYVVPKEVNIKPDEVTEDKSFTTNEVLPGTQNKHAKENISYGDLHKTIDRKINITLPDGTVKTVYQGVRFKRSASVNTATGDVTFGNWSADGPDNLDKVNMPQVAGYIPTGDVWAINYLNEDENPKDLNINYVTDTPANRLTVAKQNMAAIQNVIQNLQTEISNKEDALNKVTSQHKTSQKDLADKEKEVNDLLGSVKIDTPDAPDDIKDVQDKKLLEEALIKAKKSVSDVLDQLNSENDSIDSLKSRLADANNAMTTYKQRKGDLSASIGQDQKTIDELNAKIAETQNELATQTSALDKNIELDQDYVKRVNKYNSDLANVYVNGDKSRTIHDIDSKFNEDMSKIGQELLKKYCEDPDINSAYKYDEYYKYHPLVWNKNDKDKIVDLNDITNKQDATTDEISDYTFNLLNDVRRQLGLKPLEHNKEAMRMAMAVAKQYQIDGWTHKHHDNLGINKIADQFGLQQYKDKTGKIAPDKGQYYESLDTWTTRNYLGIVEDKDHKVFYIRSIPPTDKNESKDVPNHITDMDSIKQGIYANLVAMLMNDDQGHNASSPWGHTRQILGIGRKFDYTLKNTATKFGMAADVVPNSADDGGDYSQHFILIPDFTVENNHDLTINDGSTPTGGDSAKAKEIQDELNKYIEQRDELLKSLEEKKRELNDNDSKISNNQSVISALQDAINQKQSKIDQLKSQLPDVQGKLKAAQDSLDKHNSDAQAKQKDVQQKVQDLQKAQSELTQLQDQIKKQDSQIADLTTKTDNLKKRKIEYDKVSDDIKQNVDHATDKNNQQNQGGQENQNTQNNQNNGGQVQNNSGNNVNSNAGSAVNTTEATNATNNVADSTATNNAAAPQQETDTSAPVNTSSQDNTSDEDEPDTADMNDGNYSGSSKHTKSANEAPRAEVQHNAPKAMNAAPVHGESTTQSYVETSSNNLNTNHSESTLPQTGENADLAAIIAGDLAASLGLIGLVGLKKKKRE